MAVLKIEFLVILLCLSSLALGSRKQQRRGPTISHISPKQIRDVGDQVDLECSFQHAQDYPVVWVKNDGQNNTLMLSTNSATIIRDNRYSVRHDDVAGTNKLTLRDVQESDAGLYLCQILTSPDKVIKAEVELEVRPTVSEDNIESTTEVNQELAHPKKEDRIEATLARIEKTLARIEAIEGTAGHTANLKMDARNEATLARIETTLVRIEATLVRIEANQIEAQKQH